MNSKAKYFLAAAASCIIWGFFALPLRSVRDHSSIQILIFRILCALLLSSLITLILRKSVWKKDLNTIRSLPTGERKKMLLRMFFSGILITGNWFSFIYVINHVNVQAGAFAYMVCPIITAVFGWFFLKEQLTKIKWVSIALCFISIISLSLGFITDVLYSVFIATLYAGYLMFQKRIEGVDKFNVMLVQLVVSTTCIIPLIFTGPIEIPVDFHFWRQIIIISVLFTIIPTFLNLYGLIGMPSSTMGILIYLNPIVAFIIAFFYFDEELDMHKITAYFILLISVILFNLSFIKNLFKKKEIHI